MFPVLSKSKITTTVPSLTAGFKGTICLGIWGQLSRKSLGDLTEISQKFSLTLTKK